MTHSAVIFDLDGTITRPYLDFDAIRAEIGVEGPILEAVFRLDGAARQRAQAILDRHEHEAAENATLHDGAAEVVQACRDQGYQIAILTRNRRAMADFVLNRFRIHVDAIRTREDGAIKPSPEPVLSICKELGVAAQFSWMVGDYLFDLLAGRAAGTRTVLMVGDRPVPEFADQADFVVRRLAELLPILAGKPAF